MQDKGKPKKYMGSENSAGTLESSDTGVDICAALSWTFLDKQLQNVIIL